MFKYVPVLRYRREERGALRNTRISVKAMPLLELMKEKAGQFRNGDFSSTHLRDFEFYNFPFMVDFPLYFHITNSTTASIRNFLRQLKQNPNSRLALFEMLQGNPHMIPVISYDTERPYRNGSYQNDANRLRRTFSRLAFRVFESSDFTTVLNDVNAVVQANDILLYDIDNAPHMQQILQQNYRAIQQIKISKSCKTVLIRSAINPDIVFNRLVDGTPVLRADNTLLQAYTGYGFDAFGDFAGIRKDQSITDGGPEDPSAGFLFYSWSNNCFYGYKGRIADWGEFTNHIKPTVMASQSWNRYSAQHHNDCPGCSSISNNPGNSAGNWKRISVMHYLHTMEEFL